MCWKCFFKHSWKRTDEQVGPGKSQSNLTGEIRECVILYAVEECIRCGKQRGVMAADRMTQYTDYGYAKNVINLIRKHEAV
jgi:sulfur relay (sulfurtransferase) complex TusBCD TusD component (DsrE family)